MHSDARVEQLRTQLRRDPTDRDVAFLLTVAVRDPRVVYRAERARLRALATADASTARGAILRKAALWLLDRPTPVSGLTRPRAAPPASRSSDQGADDGGRGSAAGE